MALSRSDRSRALAALLVFAAACAPDTTQVLAPRPAPGRDVAAAAAGGIVISQVYGGGGNAGATYTNDFIELYNAGTTTVSLTGWSVQYASATGTSWQVTPLAGSLEPGHYYLVQEGAGAGGTTPLPAPDATGGIAMGATGGKVALVSSTTALTGSAAGTSPYGGATCPSAASLATVVDFVGFGSTATCFEGTGPTPAVSNTTATLRKSGGATDTDNNATDFASGAPTPRNNAVQAGPLDHVTLGGAETVVAGGTVQLLASAEDAEGHTIGTATFAWTSSDESIATVDQTGKVTGVAVSTTPVTITVTATAGGLTRSATLAVSVIQPGIAWVDASASTSSFPPGFQTQVFFTARIGQGGTVIPATFEIEALDPDIATAKIIDNTAIITGVSGSATRPRFRITATPIAGGAPYSFTTSSLVTIETPVSAPPSIYGTNDAFGDPTPASPSSPNDLLIVRPEYTLSYNESRGTPNWVSYELDARQFGGEDRCNCFTADPLLPPDKQIYTSDYTNGGYDRGHMTRSADRTAANVDNATTFYLTNVVPQQADLNQGVWAQFENALADSARAGRAVYIVTGPIYSASHPLVFLKNEGKVAIPDSTWKVAFIGPRNAGAPFGPADITAWNALDQTTVLAVNMPNVAGVRNDPWAKYLTTVDRIEQSTGFDLLSLLPDNIEPVLESAPPGVRALDMDLFPGQISLGTTAAVSVALYSTSGFDATAVSAANVRLVVGGTAVAPITRGTTVNTSVTDVNGDGLPDRVIGFNVAALRAAGLAPGVPLHLQLAGTSAWWAFDVTPPLVVP